MVINDILEEEITNALDNGYKNNRIAKKKANGAYYPNMRKRGLVFDVDGVT